MTKLKPVELTEAFVNRYYDRLNLKEGKFRLSDMREDYVKFAKFMLGFTPRDYQVYFLDQVNRNQKVIAVKGRQIGFTTSVALYCLWFGWFGKAKTGANKDTKICVISKDDDAAKKLLQQIKDFMYMGDKHMSNFLKGKAEHATNLFSMEIKKSNVDELVIENSSRKARIYSFPPTGKVRGTSNDILFIDEFDFLNNSDISSFLYTDALPSLSETAGKIILSSTPNGYGGEFYNLIDPEGAKEKHEYHRFMFPFSLNNSEVYQEQVKMFMEHMDEKKFNQEYQCSFEQSDSNFFVAEKVKKIFDDYGDYEIDIDAQEYCCGVDYGMTESRTVVTLVTEVEGILHRVYYKEFESGYDLNDLIPFLEGLQDRFNINKFIPDDCPQGWMINQKMLDKGWNVELFDFKKVKIEGYSSLRNRINKNEIKMPLDKDTEKQLIEMKQEESKLGKLMIHKPRSGRDDIVDSLVMACYPFLGKKQERVGAWLV